MNDPTNAGIATLRGVMHASISKISRIIYPKRDIYSFSICMLFYNKADQTIANIQRIYSNENIKKTVPIYIFNNNSNAAELDVLNEYLAKEIKNYEVIQSSENIGVGRGRNILIPACPYKWQLHIDNDIYLSGADWFERIILRIKNWDGKTEIYIPELYNVHDSSVGNHLKVVEVENDIAIQVADRSITTDANIFPGGACLLNKEMFVGPNGKSYDESYFVGYEDLDYSLDRYVSGNPLTTRFMPEIGLVHNHISSFSKISNEGAKARYSSSEIANSAYVLKHKFGEKFGTNWQAWVKEQEVLISQEPYFLDIEFEKNNSKILIVLDVRDWAFDNIVTNMISGNYNENVYEKIYLSDSPSWSEALKKSLSGEFNKVHVFWRPFLDQITNQKSIEYVCDALGISLEEYIKKICLIKWTTCVYDHLFLDEGGLSNSRKWLHFVDEYYVSSQTLYDEYSKSGMMVPLPGCVIADGVDIEQYIPDNLERFGVDKILSVGWVGNSKWGEADGFIDAKGVETILKPAIELLEEEGILLELICVDSSERKLSRESVRDLYSKMDVLVCSSLVEGTPNPVLEALSCGVPILSTDVGVVRESVGPLQAEYIIERSKEKFAEKLKYLSNNRDVLHRLSEENISLRNKVSWSERRPVWNAFFKDSNADFSKLRYLEKLTHVTSKIYRNHCWVYAPSINKDDGEECKTLIRKDVAKNFFKSNKIQSSCLYRDYQEVWNQTVAIISPVGRSGLNYLLSTYKGDQFFVDSGISSFQSGALKDLQKIDDNAYTKYVRERVKNNPNKKIILKQIITNLKDPESFIRYLADARIKTVVVNRKNCSDVALSWIRARHVAKLSNSLKGVSRNTPISEDEVPGPIRVDIDEFEKLAIRLSNAQTRFSSMMDKYGLVRMEVDYSDLISNEEFYSRSVSEFLGIEASKVKSPFIKATSLELTEAVKNTQEYVSALDRVRASTG